MYGRRRSSNMKYEIIAADPPWRFQNWSMAELAKRGEKWARRNGRSPYDVMDTTTIANLPVSNICAKNCVLFLWATYPKLEDALTVLHGWKFKFKTVAFTWVKLNPKGNIAYPPNEIRISGRFHYGLGYWTRQNPEICLLATRGKNARISNRVENLIVHPLMGHSRKPPVYRDRIVELLGDRPRIELFARDIAPGWDATGLECDGIDIRDFLTR